MSIVPDNRLGKIQFYESHIIPWTTNAAAIGLTPTAISALGALITAARNAVNAAESARQASRTATQVYYDAVAAMHAGPGAGQDIIDTIRNFAKTTDDPNVYNLAEIPAPAVPSAAPPPGTPFDFTVGLLQIGSLRLGWKCDNPGGTQGTIYEVMRSSGGGAFAFVGSTAVRSFTDDTLVSGSSPVTYRLTAVRSVTRGDPAQFTVHFGAGTGGLTITGVSGGSAATLAA